MKKLSLIFLISFLSLGFAFAQSAKFGIKGGWNYANLDGQIASFLSFKGESVSGFHVGAMSEFRMNDKFAFQPEIILSKQGAVQQIPGVDAKAKIGLTYINMPLLAKVYVTDKIALHAGPQVGYLIDSDLGAVVGVNTVETDLSDLLKVYNKVDAGINVGASVNLDNGFNVNASYYHGLSNVADIPLMSVHNKVFQVGVGWYLF